MKAVRNCLIILLVAAGTGDLLSAQTTRPSGTSASAQAMQQIQQIASERSQLQAENARMKKELDGLHKQVKSLQADKDAAGRRSQGSAAALARALAGNETLNQNLTQQRTRMEELVGKFRETLGNLRAVETERADVKAKLAARDRELSSCVDKNLALYKVNTEVLDRLEGQGFWSSLGKSEPFTRLKRTENENLVDEYKERARDQRVEGVAGKQAGS
jgi:predicted RNase H-like nuclease (RuvC/YqgF family)